MSWGGRWCGGEDDGVAERTTVSWGRKRRCRREDDGEKGEGDGVAKEEESSSAVK